MAKKRYKDERYSRIIERAKDYENYEPLFWEDNKGIIGDLFTAKRNE